MLCTIPPVEDHPSSNRAREVINERIRLFCMEEKITLIDLYRPLYDPRGDGLAQEYSDDGLHLTPLGYRRMAEIIYEKLVETGVPSGSRQLQ
jgi:lysophospholipase L1-like esterase